MLRPSHCADDNGGVIGTQPVNTRAGVVCRRRTARQGSDPTTLPGDGADRLAVQDGIRVVVGQIDALLVVAQDGLDLADAPGDARILVAALAQPILHVVVQRGEADAAQHRLGVGGSFAAVVCGGFREGGGIVEVVMQRLESTRA